MPTYQNDPVISRTNTDNPQFSGGVYGESTKFNGVRGITNAPGHGAVVGVQSNQTDQAGPGLFGQSRGTGVWGESKTWMGVFGKSESTTGGVGVMGEGRGAGVVGVGNTWIGVYGETRGTQNGPSGVLGDGKHGGVGVKGHASGAGIPAVAGFHLANTGPGIYGEGSPAGLFRGDVRITGDLILTGGDVAEQFDVSDQVRSPQEIAPGTVVIVDESGALEPCTRPYDSCVAGVISGAGDRVPALVLDRRTDDNSLGALRKAVAVLGKVWCWADASSRPIRVGDLLTTSSTPGHAMSAVDRESSFGAVLGKALTPLRMDRGLVLILVGLG